MFDAIRNLLTGIFGYFFDLGEFIFGILVGLGIAWLFVRSHSIRENLLEWYEKRSIRSSEQKGRVSLDRYRADLVERAANMHLASVFFALDEIVIEPRLLAPPSATDGQRSESGQVEAVSILPNLPDWKYLSGIYRTPTIPLGDALAGGANLLITGEPGAGKTTALAYLAIRAALREEAAGNVADYFPVLIHAADLEIERSVEKDVLKPISTAAQYSTSGAAASRLPGHIKAQFSRGRGLLLLDGLDEFNEKELSIVAVWIEALLKTYPETRIVAAGPIRGYDGLVKAGLTPAPIAPWSNHELHAFLRKWGSVWQEHIQPTLPKKRLVEIDPVLITGWLEGSARGYSPLELTMLVWASYVGDVRGPRVVDCYESYTSRFLSPSERRSAQATALEWIISRSGFLPERNIRRGTPVADMIQAGMLTKHIDNRISFRNPAVGAYLAACEMAEKGITEQAIPIGWAPAEAAMKYLSSMVDVGNVANRYLEVRNEILYTHLLTVATWLRESPAKAEWRGKTLRNLATVANTSENPFGLRLRAIHALAASKEMSVNILFQRLLASNYPSSRVLGALGLGGLGDENAIDTLLKIIQEKQNMHTRQAACLALGAIGTEAALEGLGRLLLEGEEGIRISAAEALACNPGEGYAMLREAVEYKDHMTRRAAVYGIARIPDEWAFDILINLQVEDDQWVVRGAAAEAVDRRTKSPVTIEPIIQDPSQLPWLVEFAARDGLGVAPGIAAMEMVRKALNKGTPDEQVAALEAIAWSGESDLTMELIQSLNSDQTHLRDAAFEALWQLEAGGVQLAITPKPA